MRLGREQSTGVVAGSAPEDTDQRKQMSEGPDESFRVASAHGTGLEGAAIPEEDVLVQAR